MRLMVFELHVMNRKKEEEEVKRITKSKFSSFLFSVSEWGSRALGTILTIVYSKGFLSVRVLAHFAAVLSDLLPYLKYRRPFLT